MQPRYNMNYVSALELEGVMQRHPAVQECLAFARPSSDLQDLVSMVVVLKTDHEASLKHNICANIFVFP